MDAQILARQARTAELGSAPEVAQEHGMTATFGTALIENNDLDLSMSRAAPLVQRARARDVWGAIYQL
jgi:hypothetical protein